MNFTRKTVFWVIALVLLAGLFHLLDERSARQLHREQEQLRLFSFTGEEVTEFWTAAPRTNTRIHLRREGAAWLLTSPIQAPGDAKAIAKLLKNILEARKDAVLFEDPSPAKLQELGLDRPEREMGFVASGRTVVIAFGDQGPTNNVAYARFQGETRVLRIHADVKREADQSVHALRDKSILTVEPLQVVRLELLRQGLPRVVVRHEQDRWDMLEPVPARAAMAGVLETMYAIKNSEIKAFIDPDAPHAADGLDAPRITVSLLPKDAKVPQLLLIGEKDRTRRGYFAKRGDAEQRFVVEEELVGALMADDTRWREEP